MPEIPFDVVLPILIVGAVFLVLFLIFGVPFLIRVYIKSTGELANAKILEMHYGRGAVYSGSEYNHTLVSQKIILKLEVHPNNSTSFMAEDRFMAKARDMMKLRPGVNIQVRFLEGNHNRVVCLPETATASTDAPLGARASMAIADLMSSGSAMSPEEVLKAFEAQGIHSQPMMAAEDILKTFQVQGMQFQPTVSQDDPKTRLEKLKSMLDEGLITRQEFNAKKSGDSFQNVNFRL
jgi:hypothetical protein